MVQTPHPALAKKAPKARVTRDRQRPIKVIVSDDERAEIGRLAGVAGMSLSGYLRAAGLNHSIRSTLDFDAIRELLKVSADLGRFGGLLKLWLAEQKGKGASAADVDSALKESRQLQALIRARIGKL
jgi:hypothetical protein